MPEKKIQHPKTAIVTETGEIKRQILKKTKFTPKLRAMYLEYLSQGKTKRDAAKLVGLNSAIISTYAKNHPKFANKVKSVYKYEFGPEKAEQYINLLLMGHSKSSAAAIMGISLHSVLKYERTHAKAAKKFRWAQQVATQQVADSLYAKAIQGDVSAIKLWLINNTKNADETKGEIRWTSENTKTEISGPRNGPIEFYHLDAEERKARLIDLAKEVLEIESEALEEAKKEAEGTETAKNESQ